MFPGKVGLCLICVGGVNVPQQEQDENDKRGKLETAKDGNWEGRTVTSGLVELEDQDDNIDKPPDGGAGVIEEDRFLKGLSILCEKLGVDEKFGTRGSWELAGVDKWAGWVCCRKCYGMLRELVRLRELIRATQISLDDKVERIESCVTASAESYPDSEFSFNSCFLFRREIMALRLRLSSSSSGPGRHAPPPDRRKVVLTKCRRRGKRPRVLITPEDYDKLNSSFVKLEKMEVGETFGGNERERGEDDQADGDEMPFMEAPSPPEGYTDKDESGSDSDKDFKPEGQKRRRGRGAILMPKRKRKRGRPKKKPIPKEKSEEAVPVTVPVKRGRGRPPRTTSNDKQVNDELKPEIKTKRGRGRPSKIRPVLPKGASEDELDLDKANEEADNDNDEPEDFGGAFDDSSDSLSEDEYQSEPEKPKRKSKYKPRNSGRPAGRPRKKLFPITVEQAKTLISDNSCHIRPVVVVDPQTKIYSYHNVPIQQEETMLVCKYPGCDFSVEDMAYFSEQLGFRTMKLHVKHFHRLQNFRIYTNSENNDKSPAPVDPSKSTIYFCCYCDAQCPTRNNLLDHVRHLHSTASPLPSLCEVCGDNMPQKQLTTHLLSHKNPEEKALALESKSKRRGRQKDTSTPLHFPCDQCPKFFKNHTLLRLHKVTHIPLEIRKQFQCDLCGLRLASHNLLRYHRQRIHFKEQMEYPFGCKICNEKFNKLQKADYQVHMRLHTGERPYQCSECGKSFHRKRNMVVHEQLHLDNKIQCEHCAQWYKNIKYLRRHHLKHHAELVRKPIRRPNNDKYHRTAVYGPDFIGPRIAHPCEPCGKVYVFKSQLISHMKHGHKLFHPKSENYPDQNTFEMQEMRELGGVGGS